MIQKRRRCLFLLPILEPKAFALPTSHRIDNAEAHARTDYIINMYIETYQTQTPCCHLPAVMLRVCEVLGSQRQTFENVFLIYKTARFHPSGLTSDGAKIRIISETCKDFEKNIQNDRFYCQKQRSLTSSNLTDSFVKMPLMVPLSSA